MYKRQAQANGFPGNTGAEPDYSANDELFVKLYEMSKDCDLVNEFLGAPVAESLMREMCIRDRSEGERRLSGGAKRGERIDSLGGTGSPHTFTRLKLVNYLRIN